MADEKKMSPYIQQLMMEQQLAGGGGPIIPTLDTLKGMIMITEALKLSQQGTLLAALIENETMYFTGAIEGLATIPRAEQIYGMSMQGALQYASQLKLRHNQLRSHEVLDPVLTGDSYIGKADVAKDKRRKKAAGVAVENL